MKTKILFFLILLAAALLSSVFAQEDGKAPRVITLAPNLTEGVFALERGNWLVAVSEYSRYPEEARDLPRVGGLYDLNAELVLSSRPDIVFHLPSHNSEMRPLKKLGVETVEVRSETIRDIMAGLRLMGEHLNAPDRAQEIVTGLHNRLEEIRQKHPGGDLEVLFVVGYSPTGLRDIYAAGADTFISEMIQAAGAKNYLDDSSVRYPIVNREVLATDPPDVIIDANESAGPGRTEKDHKRWRAQWEEFLGVGTDKMPRIVFTDDPQLTIPGPGVADSVEKLAEMIHGKREQTPTPAPTDDDSDLPGE